MDRREHHRVQLRLPARLRWTTPFGQKTEVCGTVNASRGGLLVPCQEAHAEGTSLWVTFPYDAAVPYGQPEILAKVVRSAASDVGAEVNGNGDGSAAANVARLTHATRAATTGKNSPAAATLPSGTERGTSTALRFEIAPRRHSNGNGNGHKRPLERRASTRQRLAVPVRVRPENVPWFEETMTIDCSAEGLKFRSNREYSRGQFLVVAFESADTSPWPGAAESLLVVVRIDVEPESPSLNVALCTSQQFSFRF
ncbi:MAG: PilZ domain-containing protein [Candidatus Acidiferrum sp.]|jgi:PilZ domain-containing protein